MSALPVVQCRGVRLRLAVFVVTGLIAGGPYAAAQAPASKSGDGTPPRLPDWSGLWVMPESVFTERILAETDPKNPRAPHLSAASLARLNAFNSRRMTGVDPPGIEKVRTNAELCMPIGMPAVMGDPGAIEFLFSPGRVTVIAEEGPTVRRIYTNGKARSSDAEDSFTGTSIGHWEGDTLVVETTEISPRAQLLTVVRTSGKAHVTERIHLKDPNHLAIDTVVEDPIALKSPWRYSRIYDRLSDGVMQDYLCNDNNRDLNGGEPDLTPPK